MENSEHTLPSLNGMPPSLDHDGPKVQFTKIFGPSQTTSVIENINPKEQKIVIDSQNATPEEKSSTTPRPSTSPRPSYTMTVWDETQKKFMKQMIDRGKCYVYLHDSSFRLYKTLWLLYMIPVVAITTFSGVANLGQLGFLDSSEQAETARIVYPIVLGTVNIIAAILASSMQFFKIAEQKESHRRAEKDWIQFVTDMEIIFYSQFEIEVRNKKFNKMLVRYKLLLEKSPSVPRIFLNRLGKKYRNVEDLILPEMVGEIKPTTIQIDGTVNV